MVRVGVNVATGSRDACVVRPHKEPAPAEVGSSMSMFFSLLSPASSLLARLSIFAFRVAHKEMSDETATAARRGVTCPAVQ
jgi:hypothetical protein